MMSGCFLGGSSGESLNKHFMTLIVQEDAAECRSFLEMMLMFEIDPRVSHVLVPDSQLSNDSFIFHEFTNIQRLCSPVRLLCSVMRSKHKSYLLHYSFICSLTMKRNPLCFKLSLNELFQQNLMCTDGSVWCVRIISFIFTKTENKVWTTEDGQMKRRVQTLLWISTNKK